MQLHLNPPLEPANAPRHAAAIVAAAADISGAALNYSPESIDLVEDIVDGFRAEGVTGEDMAESLVAFGCYVGEILTRHVGGVWRHASAAHPEAEPIVVELPDARECHPIDWVFSRLEFGADVSIRDLYAAAGADGAFADERTCE
ncbi:MULTISPECIES: hypothetical protein [unclassified Streptomyces]|uniref:hypothetical protein n=1 Tax=unclassified Streptomyces TaxID=2593676 RepID=UPI0004BD68E9|nr:MULTISPECIES: hypothetical protein [unclassified Streptomyces]KOV96530.1 hypothetical protein ADL02_08300 [Streptomyces sp. NRRL WC-3723]